jgi:hypothetical protein
MDTGNFGCATPTGSWESWGHIRASKVRPLRGQSEYFESVRSYNSSREESNDEVDLIIWSPLGLAPYLHVVPLLLPTP